MAVNSVNHPDMIAKSAAVVEAFTPKMYEYLLSLLPTPQEYSETHERFETSYTASLKGDQEKAKACEADRSALNQHLSILLGLAKVVTVKDPSVTETLGLTPFSEKNTHPTLRLPAPHDFKVVYTPDGHLMGAVTKVSGAKGYEVWACEGDPNVETNWKLAAASPYCKGIPISGLNRSKPNWLKIRGMRGNSAGPWSNFVSLSPD